jgi:hypothetical protein
MADKDPRTEQRISRAEPVLLSSLEQPAVSESTRTQNISSRGARVFTQRVWQPGSRLLIKSIQGDFSARARVVYWRSFASGTFAIGLEFRAREGDWPMQN